MSARVYVCARRRFATCVATDRRHKAWAGALNQAATNNRHPPPQPPAPATECNQQINVTSIR